MPFMKFIRVLLFPVVPIYFLITWVRNKMYDFGWLSSKSYDLPIISVGNLSTGGTGKSPTIEYLVRLLQNDYKLATLSRGYKRESRGFQIANERSDARQIGDEPFQFYQKFNSITVAVDADRQNGISNLISKVRPEVILLDDAFQHRKVKPGFSILLTSYDNLYSKDIVLPTGNLREPRSGAKRANCIIVTKCPSQLTSSQKASIISGLKPETKQQVFFSSIDYHNKIFSTNGESDLDDLRTVTFTLVTGIANPKPMLDYLSHNGFKYEHLAFADHHQFKASEIEGLKKKTVILTTEKDYVRLKDHFDSTNETSLYYLPISFRINEQEQFDTTIKMFLKTGL